MCFTCSTDQCYRADKGCSLPLFCLSFSYSQRCLTWHTSLLFSSASGALCALLIHLRDWLPAGPLKPVIQHFSANHSCAPIGRHYHWLMWWIDSKHVWCLLPGLGHAWPDVKCLAYTAETEMRGCSFSQTLICSVQINLWCLFKKFLSVWDLQRLAFWMFPCSVKVALCHVRVNGPDCFLTVCRMTSSSIVITLRFLVNQQPLSRKSLFLLLLPGAAGFPSIYCFSLRLWMLNRLNVSVNFSPCHFNHLTQLCMTGPHICSSYL